MQEQVLNFKGIGLPVVEETTQTGSRWIKAPGAYTITGIAADGVSLEAGKNSPFLKVNFNTSHGIFEAKFYFGSATELTKTGTSKLEASLQRINELHLALTGQLLEGQMSSLEALTKYLQAVAAKYVPTGEKLILRGKANNKNPEEPYADLVYTGFIAQTELPDGPFVKDTPAYNQYVQYAVDMGKKDQAALPLQTVTKPQTPSFDTQGVMPSWNPESVPDVKPISDLPF